MARILNVVEAGVSARNVCRQHEVTRQTFYRWKVKYGGMDVAEAEHLRMLERENTQL